MKILNIHYRVLPASPEIVGELIDSLAGPSDLLWPWRMWPAMRFDRPLGVGAAGGHGPVRYWITEYEPSRLVRFQFNARQGPCVGLEGIHWFEIEDVGSGKTLLRHVIDGMSTGGMILRWPLVFRSLHDALIEDALDNAERQITGTVKAPAAWSTRVKFLRRLVRKRG